MEKTDNMNTKKIEEAVGRKNSRQYNCAQAVACTFCTETGADEAVMKNVCNAFGTGMGNMEGTCGALVGAGVVLGLVLGDRTKAMQAQRRIMEKFQQRNGATVCKMLKGKETGVELRPCLLCVADATEFVLDELKM